MHVVERRKDQLGETKAVTAKKKLDKQEEQLRANSRDLNFFKMKSVLVIGFTFTALMGMFNTMYVITIHFSLCTCHTPQHLGSTLRFDGHIVAKLPFEPFSLIRHISHRNLMGEDYTDCSFIFLYILCTMSIREVRMSPYMPDSILHFLFLPLECAKAAGF